MQDIVFKHLKNLDATDFRQGSVCLRVETRWVQPYSASRNFQVSLGNFGLYGATMIPLCGTDTRLGKASNLRFQREA